MDTKEISTLVTTYKGIQVFVNEHGIFSATPKGKRKERKANTLRAIRNEIDDAETASFRRKDANVCVPIFHNGTSQTNAVYVGARVKDTATCSSGHNFKIDGDMTNPNSVQVFRAGVLPVERNSLEASYRVMLTAQESFNRKLRRLTVRVAVPYIYEGAAPQRVQEMQDSFLATLNKKSSLQKIEPDQLGK